MEKLLELLTLFSPSGDESAAANWLEAEIAGIAAVTVRSIGDNVIGIRGTPRTAIFAHTDTTGFTLGYDRKLIKIGGPDPSDGDKLRSSDGFTGRLLLSKDGHSCEIRNVRNEGGKKAVPVPGSRWAYAKKPSIKNGTVTSPYLDNRAGVWAALETLRRCENMAVAFCVGEETNGHGARVCAESLYRENNITQALISDITWHTRDTPCGKGVAISLRDGACPRQTYLERILSLAEESEILYQREIQSAGGSDGGHILRSSVPMDWVFVGAPEKRPHTSREKLAVADLESMRDMLVYLTDQL